MVEHIDKEIDAIRAVLKALEPLPPDTRRSVIEYVFKRLNIERSPIQHQGSTTELTPSSVAQRAMPEQQTMPTHIKDLKAEKKPRSANEMAALTAFYLANVDPPGERKDTITTKDIETYFKIAEFPLPRKPEYTLQNARAAGYLDAVGNGEYKLNAVGHNLVVHSMPRGHDGKAASNRRPSKKTRPKKTRRTKK